MSLQQRPTLTLQQILTHFKITNITELNKHKHELSLKIHTGQSLKIDGENRLYSSGEINFEYAIIETSLCLKDQMSIKFKDCIILGDISVNTRHNSSMEIHFFDCIFSGNLSIFSHEGTKSIYIDRVNSRKITISGCNIEKIDISRSHIGCLSLSDTNCYEFNACSSKIHYIENESFYAQKYDFSYAQISRDYFKNVSSKEYCNMCIDTFDNFKYSDFNSFDNVNYTNRKLLNDINFLYKYCQAEKNKSISSDLDFLINTSYYTSKFEKIIVKCTGNFSKPSYFIYYSIIIIIICATLFTFPICTFQQYSDIVAGLCFIDALYYSFANYTTLVFGDIIPKSYPARFIAVIESFSGIFLFPAFLVALVRRYIG